MSKLYRILLALCAVAALAAFDCRTRADGDRPYEGLDPMAFNQRSAVPLSPAVSPLLPQADSAQAHDIPTGVSPTTAKLQDWIFGLAGAPDIVSQGASNGNGDPGGSRGEFGAFSSDTLTASTFAYVNLGVIDDGDIIVARGTFVVEGDYGGAIGFPTKFKLMAHYGGGGPLPGSDHALDGGEVWLSPNAAYAIVPLMGSLTKSGGSQNVVVYLAVSIGGPNAFTVPDGDLYLDQYHLYAEAHRQAVIP